MNNIRVLPQQMMNNIVPQLVEEKENNIDDSSEELDISSCSICKDLLCEPVTLLCQHSFCLDCLKDYKGRDKRLDRMYYVLDNAHKKTGCPKCEFPFVIPPKYNKQLETFLQKLYPEEYEIRKQHVIEQHQKEDLITEMRGEVWEMIKKDHPSSADLHNKFLDPPRLNWDNIKNLDRSNENINERSVFYTPSVIMSVTGVSLFALIVKEFFKK